MRTIRELVLTCAIGVDDPLGAILQGASTDASSFLARTLTSLGLASHAHLAHRLAYARDRAAIRTAIGELCHAVARVATPAQAQALAVAIAAAAEYLRGVGDALARAEISAAHDLADPETRAALETL